MINTESIVNVRPIEEWEVQKRSVTLTNREWSILTDYIRKNIATLERIRDTIEGHYIA